MPRRQIHFDPPTGAHLNLPGIAQGHPAHETCSLIEMLSAVIVKAESLGLPIVAEHLAMALKLAERRAAEAVECQD